MTTYELARTLFLGPDRTIRLRVGLLEDGLGDPGSVDIRANYDIESTILVGYRDDGKIVGSPTRAHDLARALFTGPDHSVMVYVNTDISSCWGALGDITVATNYNPDTTIISAPTAGHSMIGRGGDRDPITGVQCPRQKFSDRGIPILPMNEKLEALTESIQEKAWEDVIGHLFDLLAHANGKLDRWPLWTVQDLERYYGSHPTPIEDGLCPTPIEEEP